MQNAGLWAPYIDEPEMSSWYDLPAHLAEEAGRYRPDGTELEPLNAERYAAVHAETVAYANQSVAQLRLPYHNSEHFRKTEEQGLRAAVAYERLTGATVPQAVKQALALALRLHDCHHCGSSFRANAPRPELLWRPELDRRVSAEWVSALAADELGRAQGLPTPWRVFETMVIWSSTYGSGTPLGDELGIPAVRPQGLWGSIMRAADVFPSPDYATWIREANAVMYGEILPVAPPASWDEYLAARIGFLEHHIVPGLDRLDAVAGCPLTTATDWRRNVEVLRAGNKRLQQDDAAIKHLIATDVARYGVVFH